MYAIAFMAIPYLSSHSAGSPVSCKPQTPHWARRSHYNAVCSAGTQSSCTGSSMTLGCSMDLHSGCCAMSTFRTYWRSHKQALWSDAWAASHSMYGVCQAGQLETYRWRRGCLMIA